MTSACLASSARRSAGAWAVVMTIVRAYAGASEIRRLAGSRSSRAVTTAIGGVGGRLDRRSRQGSWILAGL
jgi:hypothetical protein